MRFMCECGSTAFHTFFSYPSVGRSRFRCKQCNRAYQKTGSMVKEVDVKAMWKKARETYERDE